MELTYDKVAVLIPCLNEEKTVGRVVEEFQAALPGARVYVFDNDSEDRTSEAALESGATVRQVHSRGKGNVVVAMFREIDAEYFLIVDGDGTYPASHAARLLEPVMAQACDMAVGARVDASGKRAFPKFHRFGNNLISKTINLFFKSKVTDVFSGYRAMNRSIVKSLPLLSKGFEVETEQTLQALDKGFTIREVEVPYYSRPEGSRSKLNTFLDGFLVLRTILSIIKDYRPLLVFSVVAAFGLILSLGFGIFVISEFLQTGQMKHPSTAALASGLMIFSLLSLATGLILDTIKRHFAELYFLQRNHLSHRIGETKPPASSTGPATPPSGPFG